MQRDYHPDAALMRFAERLPTTIRDVILAHSCASFGRLQGLPTQDLFATFCAIIRTPKDEARAYVCAKMAAVVELVLHDDSAEMEAALYRHLSATTGTRQLEQADLRSPLTQKHWRAARDEFQSLRSDVLSVRSLHGMLVQPHTPQQDEARRRSTESDQSYPA